MSDGLITPEWLTSVGIYPDDNGRPEPEHGVRIRGGTDDGWKKSSDDDTDGDEIASLVVVPSECGKWAGCYVETYRLPDLNTAGLVELGARHSRLEILDLCRALKAWAVSYPDPPPAGKHTGGPWRAWLPGRKFVVPARNFAAVCELNDHDYPGEAAAANAHLMASAPELLACCEKVLAAYDAAHEVGRANWSGKDVDEMRAVVAKAKGHPPASSE